MFEWRIPDQRTSTGWRSGRTWPLSLGSVLTSPEGGVDEERREGGSGGNRRSSGIGEFAREPQQDLPPGGELCLPDRPRRRGGSAKMRPATRSGRERPHHRRLLQPIGTSRQQITARSRTAIARTGLGALHTPGMPSSSKSASLRRCLRDAHGGSGPRLEGEERSMQTTVSLCDRRPPGHDHQREQCPVSYLL